MNQASLQERSSQSSDCSATRSNASALAVDCFNEDLEWILGQLAERSGASIGLISGHVRGESGRSILARHGSESGYSSALYDALAARAEGSLAQDPRRRSDDAPELAQERFHAGSGFDEDRTLCCLRLNFSPTPYVSVVATVCKADSLLGFTAVHRAMAARLYPVLSRYVRLWWMHGAERRRVSSLSCALNVSDLGILLLDRRGEILFANSRAGEFLENEDGLRRHDRSVAATHIAESARLRAAIAHEIQCNLRASSPPTCCSRAPMLTLHREGERRPLIAAVMHVGPAAIDSTDPAVFLCVLDPDQSVADLLGPACTLYRLTATETRLVCLLVRGERLADAAKQLRVQFETARGYLKQIFLKTRTNRQVDLVRVMLASAMPTNSQVQLLQ